MSKKPKHSHERKPSKKTAPETRHLGGAIRIGAKSKGFVTIEGLDDEVVIDTNFLNTALHRDLVEIAVHSRRPGSEPSGEVTKIIKRARESFVGVIECEGQTKDDHCFLVADDKKMYVDIFVPRGSSLGAKAGDKAIARITNWKDARKNPEGEVTEILGRKGEHEAEIKAIMATSGIDYEFPTDVEEEARQIERDYKETVKKELASGRKDMRNVTTFTIDPADAKDFDDALSFVDLGKGRYEIGIHIADVSFFVRPNSVLDKEAEERANSVYLVDRTIPMLPESLSNNICSLMPNEDRLAYSAVFTLDKNGHVENEWFGRTMINSNKRFTYKEAQNVIDSGDGPHATELLVLDKISKRLNKERIKNGSIIFDRDEIKIVLNDKMQAVDVMVKEPLWTHKLIEEFMLLANVHVAKFLSKRSKKLGGGSIYRIHEAPDADKMQNLNFLLSGLGYEVGKKSGQVTPHEINQLFEDIQGKPEENLVQTAILRSMSKAVYSTKNKGHYGLGFDHYTHFTSPIRRYPDILIHRLMTKYLSGENISNEAVRHFDLVVTRASEIEKESERAERNSIRFKQLEYMKPKVGQIFTGIISSLAEWGLYVEEEHSRTEGLVPLRKMGDDYYQLDPKAFAIVGSKSKKKYRLGDKIKVKLSKVDLDRRELDWEIVKN